MDKKGRFITFVGLVAALCLIAVVLDNQTLQRTDTLTIEMASGGGFVGRFTK